MAKQPGDIMSADSENLKEKRTLPMVKRMQMDRITYQTKVA